MRTIPCPLLRCFIGSRKWSPVKLLFTAAVNFLRLSGRGMATGSFQNKDCRLHGHHCEGSSLFVLLAALSCLVFCAAVRCTRQEVIELLIGFYLIVGLRERRNQPGTVCGRTRVAEIIIQFINLFLFHRKPSLSCHQPKVDDLRTLQRAAAYYVTNRRLMTCARFSVLPLICCTL